jgi:hypothetical protein
LIAGIGTIPGTTMSIMSEEARAVSARRGGFLDAADFGFSPDADGWENVRALQSAVDQGGSIVVTRPGTYDLAGTVYIGGHTALEFGHGVVMRKVAAPERFSHVFMNKGARNKTYDEGILLRGLRLIVNGVDVRKFEVYGLRGQVAFFYVRDLRIEGFRCMDLGAEQFGIHVCTFEDLVVEDAIIKGDKDGVHLGRGKRFAIRGCRFATFDDAIALNAHDYAVSNPELGWIEDGVVEDCHDLHTGRSTGFFCRILAGAWTEWRAGMEVGQSDAVVSARRVYRVQAKPDGARYVSLTRPVHAEGQAVLDGITWGVVQNDPVLSAGVRRIVFRDIVLAQARPGFSVHFDNDRFSRSYYPGAEVPVQEMMVLDHVTVVHDREAPLITLTSPVNALLISGSTIGRNAIEFRDNGALPEHPATRVVLTGCVFSARGDWTLTSNAVPGKCIDLHTSGSLVLHDDLSVSVAAGKGRIRTDSDLPGLRAGR